MKLTDIEISEELFNFIKQKKLADEDFDKSLRRMLHFKSDSSVTDTQKILLLGKKEVGKTTIRKSIFEYANPEDLLKNPPKSTKEIEYHPYSYFDINTLIFDLPGNEIEKGFTTIFSEDFTEIDHMIYIVDILEFSEHYYEIYDLLRDLTENIRSKYQSTVISLFIHKIDLLPIEEVREFRESITEFHNDFQMTQEVDIPIFFTSIKSEFLKRLNFAFLNLFYMESDYLQRQYEFEELNIYY